MKGLGLRIGLVTAVLLLIAVATIGAVSALQITQNGITIELSPEDTYTDTVNGAQCTIAEYSLGSEIEIKLISVPQNFVLDTAEFYLVNCYTNELIPIGTVSTVGASVKASNIDVGDYYVRVIVKSTGGQSQTFDSSTLQPNQNNLVIRVKTVRPEITITMDNPNNKVALGDYAYFEVKILGGSQWNVAFDLDGPWDDSRGYSGALQYLNNGQWTPIASSNTIVPLRASTTYDVRIATSLLSGVSTGPYKFKVSVYDNNGNLVAKKSYEFEVVRPTVTVDLPDEVILTKPIEIKGTTNIAERDSKFDFSVAKHVFNDEQLKDVVITVQLGGGQYQVRICSIADLEFNGNQYVLRTLPNARYLKIETTT